MTCTKNSTAYNLYYRHKEFWIPDINSPIKTLHVNFNIWQRADGTGNVQNTPEGISRLDTIAYLMNRKYQFVSSTPIPSVSYPIGNITDSKIRIVLDSIYFYRDSTPDSSYYYPFGNKISLFQKYITQNYPERNNSLNIFFTNGYYGQPSVAGYTDPTTGDIHTYDHGQQGIWFQGAEHLPHELGHSFLLWHTYDNNPQNCIISKFDFLYDVYDTTNYDCDNYCIYSSCPNIPNPICETCFFKGGESNNLMGAGDSHYISPLQIGIIHRSASLQSELRKHLTGYGNIPYEITQDEIWDFSIKYYQDIIVTSGNTLTIQCILEMVPDAHIIVETNAKLIIDGGKITNEHYYNSSWQGIEVWGNPSLSQTPANQGTLVITNGGTIENALVAVRLGSKDYTNKGGGMIFASNAVFRNNRTGVEFEPYNLSNFSNFGRCTFETTAGLPGNQIPLYFVRMTSVGGINIKGCTFQNTRSDEVPYSDRGIGIYSVNSVFVVDKVCISGTTPCTSYRYPVFDILNYAIKALATSSTTPCYIREGQFENNRRGVYLSGISSATFTNNIFNLSLYEFEGVNNDTIYGAYFDACRGYTFHENQFISDEIQASGDIALGLIINNSGPDNNLVYDNYFENVFTSTLIQGENRNNGGSTGLVIKCNQFVNTLYDIVVTYPGLFSTPYMGIALHQGANTLNNPDMAGNLFYYNLISNDYDDINNKANLFYYYYPTNTSETRLKPKDYTKNKVTLMSKSNTPSWTRENGCPEATNPGGGESESLLLQMNETGQQIDSTQNILSLLIDAGDTESLQYEVETSTSSSSMQVYNELMNTSPYLSDTVVSTAIEKEDVLPNAMLRDVMVANPNTAKSDELLSKLDSRWDPMPDYMKAQILQGRSIISLREETEANLSGLKLKKSLAFYGLVNHYLTKPDLDSLALLFASDNTLSSKYRLAFLYLGKGDVTEGTAVLATIPSQFELTSEELTSHQTIVDYYTLLAALPQGNFIPDSTQLVQIMNISLTASGNASVYARNVLLALNKTAYNEPILLPELYKSAEADQTYETLFKTGQPPSLKVYPNPSKDYIIVEFISDITKNSILEINDSNGRSLKTIQLNNSHDQLVLDTRGWKPGIYIATLKTAGKTTGSCKFSIVR